MTAKEFDAAVERMRAFRGGAVNVEDFFPSRRTPYRYAMLMLFSGTDYADRVRELAILAVEIGGYLTMHTHYSPVLIEVSLSRPLTAEEIGDNPPCATRRVA